MYHWVKSWMAHLMWLQFKPQLFCSFIQLIDLASGKRLHIVCSHSERAEVKEATRQALFLCFLSKLFVLWLLHQQLSTGGASNSSLWLSETHHLQVPTPWIITRPEFDKKNKGTSAGRGSELLRKQTLLLTVCVRAGVKLQVLHVFAVQLHVELLQWVFPLPQSWFQPQDPLNVFLHQTGLKPPHKPTINLAWCQRFKNIHICIETLPLLFWHLITGRERVINT